MYVLPQAEGARRSVSHLASAEAAAATTMSKRIFIFFVLSCHYQRKHLLSFGCKIHAAFDRVFFFLSVSLITDSDSLAIATGLLILLQ